MTTYRHQGPIDDVADLIGGAFSDGADSVIVASGDLPDGFFDLSTGVAGEIVQKFVNYRLRLTIVGDITAELSRSAALRAFVAESNRGNQLRFEAG